MTLIQKEIKKFFDKLDLKEYSIPVNIEEKIRSEGIILNKNYLDFKDNICGEIKKENGKFIININGVHHYYRQRFTMAHELAHFELHRDLIGEGVDDNIDYKKLYRKNNKINDIHEEEANKWALNILMPEEAVIKVAKLTKVIELVNGHVNIDFIWLDYLSKKFKVSKTNFVIRLANLHDKIIY